MKRFKVIYKEPVIHKDAVENHKNFDQLLKDYKIEKISFPKYHFLLGGAAVVIALISCYFLVEWKEVFTEPTTGAIVEQEVIISEPVQDLPRQKSTENAAKPTTSTGEKEKESSPLGSKPAPIPAEEAIKKEEENERGRRMATPGSRIIGTEEHPRLATSEEELAASFMEAYPKEGMQNLYLYFNESLVYPRAEMDANVEGTVILSFSINKKGRPENIEIVQPVSGGIDREARRLIEEMPDWAPAQVKGKAVSSRVTLPITFKITE